MKCKSCQGTGRIPFLDIVDNKIVNIEQECPVCNGTGKIEQTNEQWFCLLPTEEKAKVIYKIAKDNFQELRKMFYLVANDDCDAIAMWLKEVHE